MDSDSDKKGSTITPIDAETDEWLYVDTEATAVYDQKVAAYLQNLHDQQNLLWGIGAGLFAALVMSGFWALMAVVTMLKSGFVAIAVGFVVAMAVRYAGKGRGLHYRLIGAALALGGVVLGNLLVELILGAQFYKTSIPDFYQVVTIAELFQSMNHNMMAFDALFYCFAVYEGFRFSVKTIKDEDLERAGMA